MPLVINGLGGGHTHKHTYGHPHGNNLKSPDIRLAHAWFKNNTTSNTNSKTHYTVGVKKVS